MPKTPLAPPQRLEVLWFEIPNDPFRRMFPIKDLPELAAATVISEMEAQGYRFVQLGSSELPE